MKLFFSVGEPSGDRHAAMLVRALRKQHSDLEIVGFGGPQLTAVGAKLSFELTQLAVMGIIRAIWNYRSFYNLVQQARAEFKANRPDAVVLVDFPGFNWHIAKAAKELGIPVYWFCPPQLWAWGGWRIHKMRRNVDHVLCTLPFDADFYTREGLRTHFVGHPFFDHDGELADHTLSTHVQKAGDGPLVTILPGSRTQEVIGNFRYFLKAADLIEARLPKVRFAVAAFKEAHADLIRKMIAGSAAKFDLRVGQTPELIQRSTCCLAVSGSVSLELMHYEKPTVVHYAITKTGNFTQNLFRRVKYITLVNLLATKELHPADLRMFDPQQPDADQIPFPEYMTPRDVSREMAEHICHWLQEPAELDRKVRQLRELKAKFAQPGASQKAATYILQTLAEKTHPAIPRPHTAPVGVRTH